VDAGVTAIDIERVEEALHRRVVEAVPLSAHRRRDPSRAKSLAVGVRCVSAAPVAVMNEPRRGSLSLDDNLQRLGGHVGVQGVAHRPADACSPVQAGPEGLRVSMSIKTARNSQPLPVRR
jgi:hypothetical protein